MALTPFSTPTDPFWDMGIDFPSGMGYDTSFPRFGSQLAVPRLGGQLGVPSSMQAPQLGVDLTEEDDRWVVHADMPGFKDDDVELTIENGILGMRATRDKTVESDTGISHRVERSFGEVRRAIRLPKGADQDHAQAHLSNGVLTINFPKLAIENAGKKIPLTIAGGSTSGKGKKKAGK